MANSKWRQFYCLATLPFAPGPVNTCTSVRPNRRKIEVVYYALLFSLYSIHKLPRGNTTNRKAQLTLRHIIVAYFRANGHTEKNPLTPTSTRIAAYRNLYNLLLNYLAVKALNNLCSQGPKLYSHAPSRYIGPSFMPRGVFAGQHESVISLKLNLFKCTVIAKLNLTQ